MPIQESGEMYLETILVLSREYAYVRAVDICERMGYSKPSVSRALGLLRDGGFITVDSFGAVRLTDVGLAEAEQIYDRHMTLTKAFTLLGVTEATASEDACRIEHYISDETIAAIKKHLEENKK